MLLNPFKMAATYPFLIFSIKESYGQLIPQWYTLNRKSLINSNKFCFWIGNLLELDPFDFYRWKIHLRSCSNWLIGINPRSLPPRNELILSTRAPSWTIYNPTKKKGFRCNRTNNVEPRAPSCLDKSKMVDVKIHNGPCPSSRTLLSTTSFQTKFYHNIPLI